MFASGSLRSEKVPETNRKPVCRRSRRCQIFFRHRFQPGDVGHLQGCVTQHLQARTGSLSLNQLANISVGAAALHALHAAL
jgi:hypothetical protein